MKLEAMRDNEALKSAKKQVNRAKRLIDEWLGATFTKENGWMFLGVLAPIQGRLRYKHLHQTEQHRLDVAQRGQRAHHRTA